MRTGSYNGNDPIEAYLAIKDDMYYIRRNKLPVLSEFHVSRLYGHSSASGANPIPETDCITEFEEKLMRHGLITQKQIDALHKAYYDEAAQKTDQFRTEADPSADTIWDNTYVDNENADWRNF